MEILRKFLGRRQGNAAVEFGLIAPFFVMALLGMIDYGIVAMEKANLSAAARAGLQAVLNDASDTGSVEAAVRRVATGEDVEVDVDESCLCSDGSEVECDGTCDTGGVRKWVSVSVTDDIPLLVPWPGWEDPLTVQGDARVRVR